MFSFLMYFPLNYYIICCFSQITFLQKLFTFSISEGSGSRKTKYKLICSLLLYKILSNLCTTERNILQTMCILPNSNLNQNTHTRKKGMERKRCMSKWNHRFKAIRINFFLGINGTIVLIVTALKTWTLSVDNRKQCRDPWLSKLSMYSWHLA